MNEVTDTLRNLTVQVRNTGASGDTRGLGDEDLVARLRAAEDLVRAGEMARLAAIGEIDDRSRKELGSDRLSFKLGCRNSNELIQRVTQASGATVGKQLRLARGARSRTDLAGTPLPALFPEVSAAIKSGMVGFDTAHLITAELERTAGRAGWDAVNAAETELIAAATGVSTESGGVPCSFEDTRIHVDAWKAILDPDGEEPDEVTFQRRTLIFGKLIHNLIEVRGYLLPEVAAQFITLLDAYSSLARHVTFEETGDPFDRVTDPRTTAQQAHDLFASIVNSAARTAGTPTLGGAAPTVLVSVNAGDLEAGDGAGFIDHLDTPISMTAVQQFACNGGTQKAVQDTNGAIISLYSKERCATPQQRRAVAVRDGGCIIPGCGMPIAWTEFHQVIGHADGGPTDVGNLVALCWFHHHTIDTSGWQIRMRHGIPEVKAPPWTGSDGTWHPTTKSRTRITRTKQRRRPRNRETPRRE